MIETCSAMPQGGGFVSSMTSYVDCQAQILGSGAWSALAAPGSTLMVVLTGFLTIFIALAGYNLLLGQTLTVRGATLAFVKIGAVFALATSWPAYRILVYDLVVDGPAQLVREIGPQAGVAGSDGTLLQRLDFTDHALVQLAVLGPGRVPANDYDQIAPPPFGGFDAFALGGSRILFLLTSIAGLTAVRVVAGLMLALGPFFIAFLLFDSTRSLFEGWVRVLGGAAIASVGASIVLGLELTLMEPWLSGVLARRIAGEALPSVSTELFVLSLLFAILVLATLYGSARVAWAFRLPAALRIVPMPVATGRAPHISSGPEVGASTAARESERSRAAAMASLLAKIDRREVAHVPTPAGGSPANRMPAMNPSSAEASRVSVPLGRTFNRRPNSRVSERAATRDARA